MDVNIDLTSSREVAEYLRSQGYNIIPIMKDTKEPPMGFNLKDYFEKPCDFPITDEYNIAMLHGKVGNTYAIDIDIKDSKKGGKVTTEEALKVLFNETEKALSKTIVVKTPKQGCHIIFKPKNGIFPPKNAKYSNEKQNIGIDIKTEGGYTLLPPSTHPEKQFGKYVFLSNTLQTHSFAWENVQKTLVNRGFHTSGERTNNNFSNYNNNDVDELLKGNYTKGERRSKMRSLYCKLRVIGYDERYATNEIHRVNDTCIEPLSISELNINVPSAESYFITTVEPGLIPDEALVSKKKNKGSGYYDMASQLTDDYNFISHISKEIYYYSNGIYHKCGDKLIRQESRERWEGQAIKTNHIVEIENIIRDKTMILQENNNKDIFDLDYKKLILQNGIWDFDSMGLLQHTPEVHATIKHPITYDNTKECPKFDAFLESCFNGNKDEIGAVLEMMALCFIKKTLIQKGYVNYGIGSNGKSTFLSILRNMLGIENTTSIPMQQFQKSQFIGYELRSKSANLSGDGGTEPIMKTGFIKSLLGGDAIRCEEKYKNPFDYVPFTTLIFTFNELPTVNDSSDGFARKIQPIHWGVRFYGDKINRQIDKLPYDKEERGGIFNKLIPIIKRIMDTKELQYENTVQETKEIWLSRSDSFFKFKNDNVVVGKEHQIEVNTVKSCYKKICEENGMTILSDNALFNKISDMLGGRKPVGTRMNNEYVRVWKGFTLKSELDLFKET
jgi:P4 family phage/plasmid primase-like protien